MKSKNYEKVVSTNKGKLQFFKQTPMKVKKSRIKNEPVNYIEDTTYTTTSKKRQAISKVCKTEKWKSERNILMLEKEEFCKVAHNFLDALENLETIVVENKVSTKVSGV